MSLITGSFVKTEIPNQFSKDQLTLAGKVNKRLNNKSLCGVKYPITLLQEEVKALNYPHIVKILNGEDLFPSKLANLPKHDLCGTVIDINMIYLKSIQDYEKRFLTALTKDLDVLLTEEDRLNNVLHVTGACGTLISSLFTYFVLGITSTWGVVGLSLMGGYLSRLAGDKVCRNNLLFKGSRHRMLWMMEVNTLEKERFQSTQNIIAGRVKALCQDLVPLMKRNLIDVEKQKELQQLYAIQNALFPADKLSIPSELLQIEDQLKVSFLDNSFENVLN